MTWWAIDVRPAADRREQVGAWLVTKTGHAVEEREDGTLVTFAADEESAEALIRALSRAEPGTPPPRRRRLESVDWASRWREGLGPRTFGRLTVTPSWLEGANPAERFIVVLDPETAFGSGEHGSTRAALTLLERYLRAGDRVLDLGSGSGILAIAAAKLGADRAVGIENDVDANPVARRNAERNGVAHVVEFIDGDAGDMAPLLGPADLLLSNILRNANTRLLPSIVAALRPGGVAIFSGMEEAEAHEFLTSLASAGLDVRDEVIDAGWWAVATRRP